MRIDCSIIGAGIVGLTFAYFYKKKFPQREIVLIEKNRFSGEEASGRNSAVLHAGLYYRKNSKKAEFCLAGNTIWRILCHQWDIPVNECGKYVFANKEKSFPSLNDLYENALSNNVPKLRWATEEELHAIAPYTKAKRAIASPHTAALDTASIIKKLESEIQRLGVFYLREQTARAAFYDKDNFVIETDSEKIKTKRIVNAAGKNCINIREQLGLSGLNIVLNKGEYFKYQDHFYRDALLYPCPDADTSFLGIHSCINPDETVSFGPTATEIQHYEIKESAERKESFIDEIQQNFPTVLPEKLKWDFAGVRTQVQGPKNQLFDFWLGTPADHNIKDYYEFCGIDSPGFTAAPALARWLVQSIRDEGK